MKLLLFVLASAAGLGAVLSELQPKIALLDGGLSGSGTTTRYWDCCKPSCAWAENLKDKTATPVKTCTADGKTAIDPEIQSACVQGSNGTAYACSDQEAWVVNSTLAYGFAAASFTGGADTNECCACFLLSFQGQLSGKQFLVQVTNTGGDLGSNQFDLAIPGGGVGIFTQGCMSQWNTPSNGWGDQYGGVGSESDCSQLPSDLQSGCKFRFEYMENVSNPPVNFVQVACPAEITSKTGCLSPA